ncbi:MAG: nucleotidyltransferase domain-containing protein [SAR324 cluster bacterium]|nr:nucleotidyltransferase domain-containing protein [SAR324 cluster bacterium]
MNTVEQLLPEIISRLVQEFRPENIFLFGSHVWGNPHSDSDLDLLVIVPKSDFSPAKRASIAYRCLRDIPYPLDILVKTRKEIEQFSQVSVSLEHQILSRGKRLYG